MNNSSEKENPLRSHSKKLMTPSQKNNTNLSLSRNSNNISTLKMNIKPQSTSRLDIYNGVKRGTIESKQKMHLPILENEGIKSEKKIEEEIEKISVQEPLQEITNLNNELNLNKHQNSMSTKTKRKFIELQKEKEVAKKSSRNLIEEVNSIYENFEKSNFTSEDFLQNFHNFLNRENLINYSKIIPISLNTLGSCLLENTNFYILYINFQNLYNGNSAGVKIFLQLETFLELIDNALMYDQNDLFKLFQFYISFIRGNYTKEEIVNLLRRKGNPIDTYENLDDDKLKLLLNKQDSFYKFECKEEIVPSAGKTQKLNISFKIINSNKKKSKANDEYKNEVNVSELKEGIDLINFNNSNLEEEEVRDINEINLENIINSNVNVNNLNENEIKIHISVPSSVTNFEFNIPSNISYDSNQNNLSSDAKILYNEIVIRNKLELEIEKSHITFNKKTPAKLKLKKEDTEKFSIVSNDNDIKNIPENNSDNTNDIPSSTTTTNKFRAKSFNKKSKVISTAKIEEEEEEKTAEDIDEEKPKRKNNNMKNNKKKYQSDKKSIGKRKNDEEEEEEKPKVENKNKKTKNKKEKSVTRGRSKSSRSNSVSAKESEEEVEVNKKNVPKPNQKDKSRSKTVYKRKNKK